MKLSRLNIKKINVKEVDMQYPGQDILMKIGELYPYESGIYGYGNLWTKLERRVENIIIEELDKIDAIEVEFPKLQPKKIWDRSKRWDLYTKENDIMFSLENNLGTYGLAPTAEECASLFGANRLSSYKNLPAIYYQIGEKFRKEIRTRGYLFRPRTFVMMDAYSFDRSEEEMHKTYQMMHDAYLRIFKRLGIDIIPIISDNGTMGGKVSEEFQAITTLGEDKILYDHLQHIGINKEVLDFENKEEYLKQMPSVNLENMKEYSAVELGNNFELGTQYSTMMGLFFQDEKGEAKPYYMGCYGIGLGRIIATMIENNILKEGEQIKGFSLPYMIAPYKIQIIYKEDKKELAESLYNTLCEIGIPSILDDRKEYSLGNRIRDTYLLGTPYMLVMGDQMVEEKVILEETKTGKKYPLSLDEVSFFLQKRL